MRHQTYYLTHRDEILQKEKEKKRWLTYYEANKEAIKARRKQRRENATAENAIANDGAIHHLFQTLMNEVDTLPVS